MDVNGKLETDFAWRVLEEIDYGLILVSPSGLLQHANHLARHELARNRYLGVEGGAIVCALPAQTEELLRSIQSAAQGCRQMVTLRNGPNALPIACVPLSHQGESASVLLMLARQSGTQNLAITFFARTYGLSPAEQSVLRLLCDGLDVQEIAQINSVSENTVRTQVRSLRDKTGINSMRLLVQRVAALPPVVPKNLTPAPVPSPVRAAAPESPRGEAVSA